MSITSSLLAPVTSLILEDPEDTYIADCGHRVAQAHTVSCCLDSGAYCLECVTEHEMGCRRFEDYDED